MELLSGAWIELAIRGGVVVWLALCAIWDARRGEIPNALTMPALLLGGLSAILSGWEGVAFYGIVLLIALAAYFLDMMGGADAKILAALAGLWPLGLMTVLMGIFLWIVGRRMVGKKGNFRAGLPVALAAAATIVIESLLYFTSIGG
jgi:Flp pilus assembly protein protease CpaA